MDDGGGSSARRSSDTDGGASDAASDNNNESGASGEAQEVTTIKGRCDLCTMKDGFRDHNLQKCRECGVCVHETCYGLISTHRKKDPNWRCHACKAVGTEVKVSKPGQKKRTMVQRERPTECALCSIKTGMHAMHPLYDTHGRAGRQAVLPADPKRELPERLAWVHSLCGMVISSYKTTAGCVYACDKHGVYEGDDIDEEEEEGSSSDESDGSGTGGDEGGVMATHHLVIAGKEHGEHTPWSKVIADHRHQLKCKVCGNRDNTQSSLRIPVQCIAGDPDEFVDFRDRHPDLGDDTCFEAMHVGCARWGFNDRGQLFAHKRIYFFPGAQVDEADDDTEYDAPVTCCYCPTHAADIDRYNPKKMAKRQQASSDRGQRLQKRGGVEHGNGARRGLDYISRPTDSRSGASGKRSQQRSHAPAATKRPSMDIESDAPVINRQKLLGDMVDDTVKVIRRAQERGEEIKSATERCKAHWKENSQLPAREFKVLWKQVRTLVENVIFREKREESADEASSDDRKLAGQASGGRTVAVNRWSYLWMPDFDGEEFTFGEWDSFEEQQLPA